jgi:hypothetical protein
VQHKPTETCVGAALTEGGGGGGVPAQFWQGGGFPTVDIGQVQKGEAEESGACFGGEEMVQGERGAASSSDSF